MSEPSDRCVFSLARIHRNLGILISLFMTSCYGRGRMRDHTCHVGDKRCWFSRDLNVVNSHLLPDFHFSAIRTILFVDNVSLRTARSINLMTKEQEAFASLSCACLVKLSVINPQSRPASISAFVFASERYLLEKFQWIITDDPLTRL